MTNKLRSLNEFLDILDDTVVDLENISLCLQNGGVLTPEDKVDLSNACDIILRIKAKLREAAEPASGEPTDPIVGLDLVEEQIQSGD